MKELKDALEEAHRLSELLTNASELRMPICGC